MADIVQEILYGGDDSGVGNNDINESTVANVVNEEKPNIQESAPPQAGQSFKISETEWTEIKALLDKRYAEIATLLRYNKAKDESIQRLSAEVQKYREGFAFSALKPFINALIALREDCRKSVRDAQNFALDDEKAKKYMEYLVSDFEEMFVNIGLERNDHSISINGKPLSESIKPKETPMEPANEQTNDDYSQPLMCAETIKNTSELIEYLDKSEEAIRLVLKDKAVLDKTIQAYIALAAHTDAEHYFALVAPVSRKLYKLYDEILNKSKDAINYSGDKAIKHYRDILNDVVNGIEYILTGAGIKIETEMLDNVFDTQKHKLLKTIPTNDEKRNRTIAEIYTDCYIYDEKVIYQSKVDVHKFQQEI